MRPCVLGAWLAFGSRSHRDGGGDGRGQNRQLPPPEEFQRSDAGCLLDRFASPRILFNGGHSITLPGPFCSKERFE